ncbi:nucleoside triphosphate pyrophosphohydrolase [bacterium]|nr:nucleoside triphosphate pyrophosphohydrolase [bacterium]
MPLSSTLLVLGDQVSYVSPDCPNKIGLKAYGLNFLPSVWTKPFFVVSGIKFPTQQALNRAFTKMEMNGEDVFVRSSGIEESIDDRGSFASRSCKRSDIIKEIQLLTNELPNEFKSKVHWVIQESIPTKIKGHLSNERRVSEAARDWVVEYEASDFSEGEIHNISLRPWRDSTKSHLIELACPYKQSITEVLKNVCKWTNEQKKRVHYEWVWDGKIIFFVQADDASAIKDGYNPNDLVNITNGSQWSNNLSRQLKVFRVVNDNNFSDYRKLKNVNIYRQVGYSGYHFYILDLQSVFMELFSNNVFICKELCEDLRILTLRPLVLRTDGTNIPNEKLQMLPRSDELRSLNEARDWLERKFRKDIIESDLQESNLCLIAHHFIPAASSAWVQASPNERMVRIESLWGLPDGVNWYSHDVFDVDTAETEIPDTKTPSAKVLIQKKHKRYKDNFIAPDSNGRWKVHRTDDQHCWASSVRSLWIKEIAWNSRRIARMCGRKIIIMWFIDIPSEVSDNVLLPWYHEQDISDNLKNPISAPRRNILVHEKYTIRTINDWERIKNECGNKIITHVRIKPKEPELVRNQNFAHELAEYSQIYNFIILLSGGLLSHVYYILSNCGAKVECEDLYASPSEELEFNKLVRDKIPDKIKSHGESVNLFRVKGEALKLLTKYKVIEEAFEVKTAETIDGIAEEIADMLEVLDALRSQVWSSDYTPFKESKYQLVDTHISSLESPNKTKLKFIFPIYQGNVEVSKVVKVRMGDNTKKIFSLKIKILSGKPVFNLNFYIKEVLADDALDEEMSGLNKNGLTEIELIEALKNNILVASFKIVDSSDEYLMQCIDEALFHIKNLASTLAIDFGRILSVKSKKADKAGGFLNGLMLVKTRLSSSLSYKKPEDTLSLFEIDNDNIISDVSYLPLAPINIYPDRRKQSDSPDLFQYRFEFSIYAQKIIDNHKKYMSDQGMVLSFDVHRVSSVIECNLVFESDSETEQLTLL